MYVRSYLYWYLDSFGLIVCGQRWEGDRELSELDLRAGYLWVRFGFGKLRRKYETNKSQAKRLHSWTTDGRGSREGLVQRRDCSFLFSHVGVYSKATLAANPRYIVGDNQERNKLKGGDFKRSESLRRAWEDTQWLLDCLEKSDSIAWNSFKRQKKQREYSQ